MGRQKVIERSKAYQNRWPMSTSDAVMYDPEPSGRDLKEAMAHHSGPLEEYVLEGLAEFGEPATDLPITVEMVEIEVVLQSRQGLNYQQIRQLRIVCPSRAEPQ